MALERSFHPQRLLGGGAAGGSSRVLWRLIGRLHFVHFFLCLGGRTVWGGGAEQ